MRRVNLTFSHTTAASESGGSFLDLLCRRFPYHDKREWEERIRDGKVLLDGIPAKPETTLRLGMRLEYKVENYEEPEVPISFREIISTPDLALVHKPAGLPVHKTGKIFVHTLANLYRQSRKDELWAPLNRLDVETSGIVAFARGADALRRFSPVETSMEWKKFYLAVVQGELKQSGSIDLPLAEKPGDILRSRMHSSVDGKEAKTLFRALETNGNQTLVLIRTLTGRKHQIRAHLAALGFPIVGDKTYSFDGRYYLKRLEAELDAEDLKVLGAPHHLLHAFHLEIRNKEGKGIQGSDFELPNLFFELFPELGESLTLLADSAVFQQLSNV